MRTVYVGRHGYHIAPDPKEPNRIVLWQHDLTPDDRIVPACRLRGLDVEWLRAADPVGAFVALARLTREG